MSHDLISSKTATDVKQSSLIWSYIETLKDPYFVSKFQNFFGIHVIRKDERRPKQLTIDSVNQSNGYQRYGSHSNNLKKRNMKQELNGSDSESYSTSATDNTSDEEPEQIDYTIDNKFWYYLFSFGASLGYEMFYASFFPIWFWNIDSAVGRRLVLVWVIIMYFGQALKDVIKWPRPESPPVVVLEPEYAVEYGMPSTHAMVGSALPFCLVIFTINRYEYPLWIGIVFAILWCLLVCGSRLYLGMHSVIDILAGLLLTALLMIIIIPLVDAIDHFHLTSLYSPLITIPLIVFLSTVYPKSDRWSPARGDTCIIMGSGAGILLGSWLNYQLGIYKGPSLPPPFPILWPGYEVIGLSLLRLSIGILCIIAARAFGKVLVFSLLCYIRNLDPRDPKNKIRVSIEIPSKVITYMAMGLTITYLSPVVFRFLNIERVTMFTEI
ncbi:sphingosine-1-phosphate phosphatase 2-like [Oppia nitens]|uniref:sphingosine-1-phosphate phosphatase 2-like n=1 Tax=Oppia nitens TaxID=1686743 RepID=UPI0023DBBE77|nr:sphingosine-1-phosphate phosphatase 2-like [Oppia nitens]